MEYVAPTSKSDQALSNIRTPLIAYMLGLRKGEFADSPAILYIHVSNLLQILMRICAKNSDVCCTAQQLLYRSTLQPTRQHADDTDDSLPTKSLHMSRATPSTPPA
jgi:hypothetical protein